RRAEVRLAPAEIRARDHGPHARERTGCRRFDPHDPGMRVRGAENLRMKHPRLFEVGHVARPARDLLERVDPPDGLPADPLARRHVPALDRAHATTASITLR